MKVLCIGYFDKFSRFFLELNKELNKEKSITKFDVFSINLSGYLYTLIRFASCCWLPVKASLLVLKNKKHYENIIKNQKVYRGIEYTKLTLFHEALNINSKKQLLKQAIAYIDLFDAYFVKNKPDFVLLLGDSRMAIESCIAIANKHHVKLFYLEQGPFNTTFFNDKGVNANMKINTIKSHDSRTENATRYLLNKPKEKKYLRLPIYRFLDYITFSLFQKTKLYPIDLKFTDVINFKKSKTRELNNLDTSGKIIYLLILQIPQDVNTIYHSPYFFNEVDLVKSIYQNLPENSELIIREHPIYEKKYNKNLYSYVEDNNLKFNNSNLSNLLEKSDVIVVNNSTVGFEAIVRQKSVVVLGNAFYDNEKLCVKYSEKLNLNQLLIKANTFKPSIKNIDAFVSELNENYWVDGGISSANLKAVKAVALRINDYFKTLD